MLADAQEAQDPVFLAMMSDKADFAPVFLKFYQRSPDDPHSFVIRCPPGVPSPASEQA
jgi:hypothetical protein